MKVDIVDWNECYSKVVCEDSVAYELDDHFKFRVENYRYHPLFKQRKWDGYIHNFRVKSRTIYKGLVPHVETFCRNQGYEVELHGNFADTNFSLVEAKDFVKSIGLPSTIELRNYQLEAFVQGVRKNRLLIVSPTSSGKSLVIYLLARYHNTKTLIVVPTTTLIHQLAGDFAEYGYSEPIHKIFSGQEKYSDELFTISTWQSIYDLDKTWFDQFGAVIVDEAHHAKAKSLVDLMGKATGVRYRYGLTGTLDGTEHNQMTLEGLFGAVHKAVDAKTLIDEGYTADLRIKCIILKHPEEHAKALRKVKGGEQYIQEIDWLVSHGKRNRFIANLANSLEGNTLVLFRYVEKHGNIIHDMIKEKATCPVYFIHGQIEAEERNTIRRIVDSSKQSIIVASTGTFSEGINIKNINNMIFTSPAKSRILTLQSLGRGMRKATNKDRCVVYDISDDLCTGKHLNFTFKHAVERLKYYQEERFNYKIYNVNL